MEQEHLINNEAAAAILGISPFSMRRKVALKQVPFVRIGRRILFSPSSLRSFIEANTVQPRPRREKP